MFAPAVEKYRSTADRKGRNRMYGIDYPSREKMSAPRTKRLFQGNFNHVRRWLVNQIGRPWNAVYAELTAMTPVGTLERVHLLKTVETMVDVNTVEIDGEVCNRNGWQPLPLRGGDLYVRNGVLAMIPRKSVAKPTPTLRVTFVGQMTGVGQSNGQWFEVTFAEYVPNLSEHGYDKGRHDVFLRDDVTASGCIAAYGKAVVATGKRAMSKNEIKRHKADR